MQRISTQRETVALRLVGRRARWAAGLLCALGLLAACGPRTPIQKEVFRVRQQLAAPPFMPVPAGYEGYLENVRTYLQMAEQAERAQQLEAAQAYAYQADKLLKDLLAEQETRRYHQQLAQKKAAEDLERGAFRAVYEARAALEDLRRLGDQIGERPQRAAQMGPAQATVERAEGALHQRQYEMAQLEAEQAQKILQPLLREWRALVPARATPAAEVGLKAALQRALGGVAVHERANGALSVRIEHCFAEGQSEATSTAQAHLVSLAMVMRSRPQWRVEVIAHASQSEKQPTAQLILAQRRMAMARGLLMQRELPAGRITGRAQLDDEQARGLEIRLLP